MLQPETDKFRLFPLSSTSPGTSLFPCLRQQGGDTAWRRERRGERRTVTFLKYNCWQFLFEMSQISGSINFSAYFSLIPFLRNKQTNKQKTSDLHSSPAVAPRYFVSFAHFFLFMSRVISAREICCFSTISAMNDIL